MRNVMRGFLIVTGMTAMLAIGFASSAHAFPLGVGPTITCDKIEIDPPLWIKVEFKGTINDVGFDETVFYGGDDSHFARLDISEWTKHLTGPLTIVATADGGFLGISETTTVTLTCNAAPPATIEGVTATSAPTTTTTTTMPATTSTTIAPSTATLATGATTPRSSLPLTGASTRPLATTGALAVLAGLAAALGTKRRRKHTA
jgi:LPXTG-motif cell wall-anchored protein